MGGQVIRRLPAPGPALLPTEGGWGQTVARTPTGAPAGWQDTGVLRGDAQARPDLWEHTRL